MVATSSDVDKFSARYLGWLAASLVALLVVSCVALSILVVRFATNPPNLHQFIKPSEATTQLAILVEFANADIRMSGVQMAFALLSGFVMISAGLLLFAAGFIAPSVVHAEVRGVAVTLSRAAPGLITLLVGGGIIFAGISKQLSRPLAAEISQATGVRFESREKQPALATKGEGPASDEKRDH